MRAARCSGSVAGASSAVWRLWSGLNGSWPVWLAIAQLAYTIRSAGAHEEALRRAANQSRRIEDARLREAASSRPDECACIDADPLAQRRPQQVDSQIGVHEGVVAEVEHRADAVARIRRHRDALQCTR